MYIAQWALHLLHVQYEDSLSVYSSVGPSLMRDEGYSTCSVCVSVCVFSLFWHLAQSGVQTAVSATSARYGHEI